MAFRPLVYGGGSVRWLQRCDGCCSNGSNVGAGNVRRTGGAATGRRWHSCQPEARRRLPRQTYRSNNRGPATRGGVLVGTKFLVSWQDLDAGSQVQELRPQRVLCTTQLRLRAGDGPLRKGAAPALGENHRCRRCGRNSCTCEPASRSCQDTRILSRPALRHASKDCYGSTATSTGASGAGASGWNANAVCRGASRAPHIARAHV